MELPCPASDTNELFSATDAALTNQQLPLGSITTSSPSWPTFGCDSARNQVADLAVLRAMNEMDAWAHLDDLWQVNLLPDTGGVFQCSQCLRLCDACAARVCRHLVPHDDCRRWLGVRPGDEDAVVRGVGLLPARGRPDRGRKSAPLACRGIPRGSEVV